MSKSNFTVVTKKLATKQNRPYYKEVKENFADLKKAEAKLQGYLKKEVKEVALIDTESGTKTLYYKSLGSNVYSKKVSKL